jgi:outer membrane protein OmpA-like peptidoglycan-associated protein
MKISYFVLILITAPIFTTQAQKPYHFDIFRGTVYNIPVSEVSKGFGEHIFDNQILNNIELTELNIPVSDEYKVKFPGVKKESLFGIVFENKLTITKEGCYRFSLESDDGSILWIDNQIIINNDLPHPMKKMMDTVHLEAKTYDLKLWYYNAFPNLYGLIFDITKLSSQLECVQIQSIAKPKMEVSTLQDVVFDFNSFRLKTIGLAYLDTLVSKIKANNFTKIKIIGYTDDIGDKKVNLILSHNRALTVMKYLNKSLPNTITFSTEGLGSENPKLPNTSKENRQANRRVEILME